MQSFALLLDAGAEANALDENGESPWDIAARNGIADEIVIFMDASRRREHVND